MGREVRRVPPDWEHPKNERGFIPLHDDSISERQKAWDEENAQWEKGFRKDWGTKKFVPKDDDLTSTFEEWSGPRPEAEDFRPDWPAESCTHYQLYETVSEGTPLSPVFATEEELAQFLADHGDYTGTRPTYEQALSLVKAAWAPTMIISSKGVLGPYEQQDE